MSSRFDTSARFPFHLLAVLVLALAGTAAAQETSSGPAIPPNPLLTQHSNYFASVYVYDLQQPQREHLGVCRERLDGLSYRVFSAVGYNLANSILIQGPDGGLIIVDTTGSMDTANQVLDAFREALGPGYSRERMPRLPIQAVIYTHNHIDHTGGVDGILDQAAGRACPAEPLAERGRDGTYIGRQDCVEIVSQEKVPEAVVNTNTVIGNVLNTRSSYMYGNMIGANRINNGIGPLIDEGRSTFRMPSRTFSQELLFTAAGVNMKLVYVPSETEDELMVFLPDGINRSHRPGAGRHQDGGYEDGGSAGDGWGGPGLLLSAEVIQGPSFPNLYSLRGTSYRNPAQWFRSVDVLRTYDSWGMIPSHGVPLCGHDNIELLLRNFRDAIQFTHDQGVRFLRQGWTPPELAAHLELPPYLIEDLDGLDTPVEALGADPRDYLRPFYGSVAQSVRELYFGYLGWFDADPVHLHPTPPLRLAERMTAMMGGSPQVLTAAAEALEEGRKLLAEGKADGGRKALEAAAAELQWAAELAAQVVQGEIAADGPGQPICRDLARSFCLPASGAGDACQHPPLSRLHCPGSEAFCRAREIKAASFTALGELPMNPNWRDFYVTAAEELCGLFEGAPALTGGLVSPEITAGLPPGAWINSWTMSLRAEETAPPDDGGHCPPGPVTGDPLESGVHASLGFYFPAPEPEGSQGYALTIRCAIAEFRVLEGEPATWPSDVGTIVEISHPDWLELLRAQTKAIQQQDPELFWSALGKLPRARSGSVDPEAFFRDYFDPPPQVLPRLAVR